MTTLRVGQAAVLDRTFNVNDVRAFASLSGEVIQQEPGHQPANSPLSGVPYGLIGAALTGLLSSQIPGAGGQLVGLMLTFVREVGLGEQVTTRVEVADIVRPRGLVRLSLKAETYRGTCVEGEAVVRLPDFGLASG